MNVSQLRTPRALNRGEKGLRGFAFYFFFRPYYAFGHVFITREKNQSLGEGQKQTVIISNDNKNTPTTMILF